MLTLLRLTLLLFVMTISSEVFVNAEEKDNKLVIVTEDVYPMNYVDKETGEIKGFAIDYLNDILSQTTIDYDLQVLPWSRAYNMGLTQPNVMVFGLARTRAREDRFVWLTDFITLEFYLYGYQSERTRITRADDDYIDSLIGVIRDDFNHIEMEREGYRNLIPADGHKHMATLLNKKRVDFIVASEVALRYFNIRNELNYKELYKAKKLEFLNVPIYYAISKGTDPNIVSELRHTVDNLLANPDYVKPTLQVK